VKRFYNGLKLGLQGLLSKELRSRSRGWRSVLLLTAYLGALALGAAGFLSIAVPRGETMRPNVGAQFFSILASGFVALLALVTPALTSGSISGERERKTLDLLLITQASPFGVIIGKWLGSVFYVLFLLIASLPAFALVYLFGGVPLKHLGMVMAVAAVTALTYSSLGLLLSAWFKRTGVASLISYLLVFVLVFGLPFVGLIQRSAAQPDQFGMFQQRTPAYAYASPLTAVSSVLPGAGVGYGGGGFLQELLQRALQVGIPPSPVPLAAQTMARVQIVKAIDPKTGQPEFEQAWAPWVYNFIISGVVTLLSILLATFAIAPVKFWQAWRVRRRNRAAAARATAAG
jgi:ABC-type transport system involved in multi-copper enzyme maturation permease subunit